MPNIVYAISAVNWFIHGQRGIHMQVVDKKISVLEVTLKMNYGLGKRP